MNAVVTLNVGYDKILDITGPLMSDYASKIGADFHVINSRKLSKRLNVCYEKSQMADMLEKYQRILYVDADTIITPEADNLFHVVGYGCWGGVDEKHLWSEDKLNRQFKKFNCDWHGLFYLNTSLMVFDRTHRSLFDNMSMTWRRPWDRIWWNYILHKESVPMVKLGREYNTQMLNADGGSYFNSKIFRCANYVSPIEHKAAELQKAMSMVL